MTEIVKDIEHDVVDVLDRLPWRKNHAGGNRFGWRKDLPDWRDWEIIPTEMDLLSVPATVRLDSSPAMPAPYDQGQLGSCTANAIAGAVEFDLRNQGLEDFMPSRLFVYFNERTIEGTVSSDSGAQIRDGIKSIASAGVCPETDWPYDVTQFAQQPPAVAYSDALKVRAISYMRVGKIAKHFQAVLAAGQPIVFGITLFEQFENVAGDGIVALPGRDESPIGAHAMLIVGYTEMAGVLYFRVRNSWGPSWGDSGYCWIPASYITSSLVDDCWVVRSVS